MIICEKAYSLSTFDPRPVMSGYYNGPFGRTLPIVHAHFQILFQSCLLIYQSPETIRISSHLRGSRLLDQTNVLDDISKGRVLS